jgi:hypothetical protein
MLNKNVGVIKAKYSLYIYTHTPVSTKHSCPKFFWATKILTKPQVKIKRTQN